MKLYISTTGFKRVTVSLPETVMNSKAKASGGDCSGSRRFSYRSVLPVVLVLAIVLPFLFVRIAFLVLESAADCSSSLDCMRYRWRFVGGNDASLLGEELERAFMEANKDEADGRGKESSLETFKDLVKDITTNKQDMKSFAFKTKAMILNMEKKVQYARQRELVYWRSASHGIPKILHCLCLKLAEEYAVNSMARSRLPPPEYVSRLTDPSFYHLILFTDNVLAASVAVSSSVQSSINPEKLVFHIVTDKKTYTPMHAWFALNSIKSAVVEVKGLHHFDWSWDVNARVKETLQIHKLIWNHYYFRNLGKGDLEHERNLDASSPSSFSLMNHLWVYIPQLFPDLDKVVFLHDDIVVQHDLSSLWEIHLQGKIVSAVVNSLSGDDHCPGRKYSDYFNFTSPLISSKFDAHRCGWLFGMNIFDLQAWRKSTVSKTYLQWLKLNLNSGLGLWCPGSLPPLLIAFEGHVHPIDPALHITGLGRRSPVISQEKLEQGTVLHFSGPAKPWLEIGIPEVRSLWSQHVNISNKFIRQCIVMG